VGQGIDILLPIDNICFMINATLDNIIIQDSAMETIIRIRKPANHTDSAVRFDEFVGMIASDPDNKGKSAVEIEDSAKEIWRTTAD
jgi:hypothetical protein